MNCPICNGPTWDNRESKRNPKQPDYKCKDKTCDGAIWLDKKKPNGTSQPAARPQSNGDNFERSNRIERQHSQEMSLRYFSMIQKIPTTAELRAMTDWFQRDVGNLPSKPAPAREPEMEEEIDF